MRLSAHRDAAFARGVHQQSPADGGRQRQRQADGGAERRGGKCSTTQAKAKPTRPSTALAITAAVGLPPTRRCMISMTLIRMIGNTARMPLPPGPMRKLSVTSTPTSVATSAARNARSYQ